MFFSFYLWVPARDKVIPPVGYIEGEKSVVFVKSSTISLEEILVRKVKNVKNFYNLYLPDHIPVYYPGEEIILNVGLVEKFKWIDLLSWNTKKLDLEVVSKNGFLYTGFSFETFVSNLNNLISFFKSFSLKPLFVFFVWWIVPLIYNWTGLCFKNSWFFQRCESYLNYLNNGKGFFHFFELYFSINNMFFTSKNLILLLVFPFMPTDLQLSGAPVVILKILLFFLKLIFVGSLLFNLRYLRVSMKNKGVFLSILFLFIRMWGGLFFNPVILFKNINNWNIFLYYLYILIKPLISILVIRGICYFFYEKEELLTDFIIDPEKKDYYWYYLIDFFVYFFVTCLFYDFIFLKSLL